MLPMILMLLAVAARAETLSEDQAVRRALAASPALAASRVHVAAAGIAPPIVRSPELRVAGYDDTDDSALPDLRRNNVGLRWTPPRLSEVGLPSAMARTRAEEAAANTASEENRLAAEVRLLHRTVRLLDEQIRVADETVRIQRRIVAIVVDQVTAGVRTALDRSRAELDLASARAAAERLRSDRRIRLLRLCQKIGVPISDDLELAGADDLLRFQVPAERLELARAAEGFRREISAAVAGVRLAELRLTAVRRDRYPWFSFVQLTRQSNRGELTSRWGFQVGIDLNVFRWRSSDTRASSLELRHSQLRERAVRAAVNAEVEEITARLAAAARELSASAAEIEILAHEVEIARAQLASGQSDKTEPLAIEARVLVARQTWLSKLIYCHALAIGLDQAAGRSAQVLGA
jgi:outer membrane protein TolC